MYIASDTIRNAAFNRLFVLDIASENWPFGLLIKNQIVSVDQVSSRSEVVDDRNRPRAGIDQFLARALVRIDVGAAEGINRLLGIGHHKEPMALAALDENAPENLPLKVVGILKFIDEAEAKALAQDRRERGTVRRFQGSPHQREHVVVVELSALTLIAIEAFLEWRQVQIGEQALVDGFLRGQGALHLFDCISVIDSSVAAPMRFE